MGTSGVSSFVLSFRNDGWADATGVVANIGYIGSSGQRILVDHGGWVEHLPIVDIPRGRTLNLIISLTEDGRNFAVTDTGAATNFTDSRLSAVGEIAPGQWKVAATLSADNFRKTYPFDMAVAGDGSMTCVPETGTRRDDKAHKPYEKIEPNVGSLRPVVMTITYDEGSDVWSRRNGGGFPAVLLPFSNEAQRKKRTAPVCGLRARVTYFAGNKVEEFRRIDSGCWISEAYRCVDLEVGGIVYLVAAIRINGQTVTLANPRHSVDRYAEDHTIVDFLPDGSYELKVNLTAGEHGEYTETYWFRLDIGEQLEARRINQQLVPNA